MGEIEKLPDDVTLQLTALSLWCDETKWPPRSPVALWPFVSVWSACRDRLGVFK